MGRGSFALFGGLADTYLSILCWRLPNYRMRLSKNHPKEGERLRERRGEGGEDDLDLGGLREWVWGWNHFPGVSGHWGGSGVRGGSSSRSGDPLGISRTTGGRSSRGTREAGSTATCWSSRWVREAGVAAGGSSPTSRMRSGRAERGSDCWWRDTE